MGTNLREESAGGFGVRIRHVAIVHLGRLRPNADGINDLGSRVR